MTEMPKKVRAAERLDERLRQYNALSAEQRAEVDRLIEIVTGSMRWVPNPGEQSLAYFGNWVDASGALVQIDQLLFGGAAGGGKTDVMIAIAIQAQQRSLLLRRLNAEVNFLVDRTEAIVGHRTGFNGQDNRWYMDGDRLVMYGGCQYPGDERKFKGEPKDFIGVDEASEFLESQIDGIIPWLRAHSGQRCRVIFATNPPTTTEAITDDWLSRWFAPWLDPHHPLYPYPEGKPLWFERLPDGTFRFEEQPFDIELPDGGKARALTRSFIPAKLASNPDLDRGGQYANQLTSLPEPLRKRLERGEWGGQIADNEFQLIRLSDYDAAVERWNQHVRQHGKPPGNLKMTCLAIDVAMGVGDTVLFPRYDHVYPEPVVAKTLTGSAVAGLIVEHRRDGAAIILDSSGGWAGGVIEVLDANNIPHLPFKGAEATNEKSNDGARLPFQNVRAAGYWALRNAMTCRDANICIQPNGRLRSELLAQRWKMTAGGGIIMEDKTKVAARLGGRSPDMADALSMAVYLGDKARARGISRGHPVDRSGRPLPTMSENPSRESRRHYRPHRGGGRSSPIDADWRGEFYPSGRPKKSGESEQG